VGVSRPTVYEWIARGLVVRRPPRLRLVEDELSSDNGEDLPEEEKIERAVRLSLLLVERDPHPEEDYPPAFAVWIAEVRVGRCRVLSRSSGRRRPAVLSPRATNSRHSEALLRCRGRRMQTVSVAREATQRSDGNQRRARGSLRRATRLVTFQATHPKSAYRHLFMHHTFPLIVLTKRHRRPR
jgi:hypothetical protein